MKKFKYLSLTERELLYGWRKEKVPLREIGRRLGRDHTSSSDELRHEIKKLGFEIEDTSKGPKMNLPTTLRSGYLLASGQSPERDASSRGLTTGVLCVTIKI